jgi:hypothetical protein
MPTECIHRFTLPSSLVKSFNPGASLRSMESRSRELEPTSIERFFAFMMALAITLLVLMFIIIVRYEMLNRTFLRSQSQAATDSWLVVSYGTYLCTAQEDLEVVDSEEAV